MQQTVHLISWCPKPPSSPLPSPLLPLPTASRSLHSLYLSKQLRGRSKSGSHARSTSVNTAYQEGRTPCIQSSCSVSSLPCEQRAWPCRGRQRHTFHIEAGPSNRIGFVKYFPRWFAAQVLQFVRSPHSPRWWIAG